MDKWGRMRTRDAESGTLTSVVAGVRLPVISCLLVCGLAGTLVAQPSLSSANFFGGAGNQSGRSIVIANSTIYVGSDSGLLVRYPVPPGSATASATLSGTQLLGLAVSGN